VLSLRRKQATVMPPSKQAKLHPTLLTSEKKPVSSRFREDVIHNKTHRNSQWKWEFEFEIISLWNHWYNSERIQPPIFGVWHVSHQIFGCSFTNIELLSTRKSYNLFTL